MEPATLYILFLLPNGVLRPMERNLVSVSACESYVETIIRPMSEKATIERYECVDVSKMQSAPKWYAYQAPQKLIHGVPLDLKYMP
jgi:hypothetical protein